MEKTTKTIFERVEELENSFDNLIDTLAEELFPSEAPRNPNYLFKVIWSEDDTTHMLLDFNTLKSVNRVRNGVTIEDFINKEKIVYFKNRDLAKEAVDALDVAGRKGING